MNGSSAKQKAALWVAAVFLIGAALGGVIGYLYGHRGGTVAASNPPLSEPQRRARRVEQMTQELSLTSDQSRQLDTILSQLHAEYKAIHDQSDAQMNQTRQKGRDQIRAFLTPEQKPKFEEFLKHMDEERKRNSPPPQAPPSSR